MAANIMIIIQFIGRLRIKRCGEYLDLREAEKITRWWKKFHGDLHTL
jgi:hypothetical protein